MFKNIFLFLSLILLTQTPYIKADEVLSKLDKSFLFPHKTCSQNCIALDSVKTLTIYKSDNNNLKTVTEPTYCANYHCMRNYYFKQGRLTYQNECENELEFHPPYSYEYQSKSITPWTLEKSSPTFYALIWIIALLIIFLIAVTVVLS